MISFFKHLVDGSTDERMIYGTTQELISKFKSFGLEDFSVESTSESLFPSEIGSKEKVRMKEKRVRIIVVFAILNMTLSWTTILTLLG